MITQILGQNISQKIVIVSHLKIHSILTLPLIINQYKHFRLLNCDVVQAHYILLWCLCLWKWMLFTL